MMFLSLFSGIGGMDLGLEWAGMRCVCQVEIDPFCRRVLTARWPNVPKHDDVKTFPISGDEWHVDAIAGGFPCQDISSAGGRKGIKKGKNSSLWFEFARVVRAVRPPIVIVENVSALTFRGLDAVLGSLASLGYDAEWTSLSSAKFGAPHQRTRVFVVAHASSLSEVGRVFDRDPRQKLRKTSTFADGILHRGISGGVWLFPSASVCGMDDVIPDRVERSRLHAIGNAVDPVVAQFVGHCVMDFYQRGLHRDASD